MKAYELLAKKNGWCQGAGARNKRGRPVEINSRSACSWCLLGAVRRCYPKGNAESHLSMIEFRLYARYYVRCPVPAWNDYIYRTQEEVVELLRGLNL